MQNVDRRRMMQAGMALAVPLGGASLLGGFQPSSKPVQDKEDGEALQIQYLEVVTPKADELCEQYSAIHGVTFGDPIAAYGNARTAKLSGGGIIGIRKPLRSTETPVIRPYALVENLDEAVAAAKEAGAEIAIAKMPIPGQGGSIGIVIQGGIECGLWQNDEKE